MLNFNEAGLVSLFFLGDSENDAGNENYTARGVGEGTAWVLDNATGEKDGNIARALFKALRRERKFNLRLS